MIFTKKIEKGEIFFYFDMIGKIPAYLPLRCYSNRAGSSVRIFETYFDEKEGTAFGDFTEEKRKLHKNSFNFNSVSLLLPATNAVSERSSSSYVELKTGFGRLNQYMLLAIYKEMTDKLSLIGVAANEFCFVSDECSYLLGHFCQNDLRLYFLNNNKHQ